MIFAAGSRSGARRFEPGRDARRRPDAAGRERGATNHQVDGRAQEDRTDAAKTVEKRLRNAVPQEGNAQSQTGNQEAGSTQRGSQLDASGLHPGGDSHVGKKMYKRNISKSQRNRG